jgi:methyl-accepting chemotaxis protein
MLNLFTGVIIRSMEEAHSVSAEAAHKREPVPPEPAASRQELAQLSEQLQQIAKRLSAAPPAST